MKRTALAAALLAAALGLTGCGDPDATGSAAPGATALPAAPAASNPLTAESVIRDLTARVREAQPSVFFDAHTDPNGELGRPGKYTSKGAFTDSRIAPSEVTSKKLGTVEAGGGVEVWPSAEGARARAVYIQTLGESMPAFLGAVEYNYLAGPVILRLSGKLTPAEAAGYAKALAEVAGPVEGPVTAE